MPILQGETGNEITCPAEKTVNLDFPVLETSSYSSTLSQSTHYWKSAFFPSQ